MSGQTQGADEQLQILLELGEIAVKKAEELGATDVETFGVSRSRQALEIKNNAVQVATANQIGQMGIRVYKNGSLGTASTTTLSKEAILNAVQAAVKIAKLSPPDPKFKGFPTPATLPEVPGMYDDAIEHIEPDQLLASANELVKIGLDEDERAVIAGNSSASTGAVVVTNSNGISVGYKGTSYGINASSTIAKSPLDVGLGYEYFFTRTLQDIDVEKVARTAVQRSRAKDIIVGGK